MCVRYMSASPFHAPELDTCSTAVRTIFTGCNQSISKNTVQYSGKRYSILKNKKYYIPTFFPLYSRSMYDLSGRSKIVRVSSPGCLGHLVPLRHVTFPTPLPPCPFPFPLFPFPLCPVVPSSCSRNNNFFFTMSSALSSTLSTPFFPAATNFSTQPFSCFTRLGGFQRFVDVQIDIGGTTTTRGT